MTTVKFNAAFPTLVENFLNREFDNFFVPAHARHQFAGTLPAVNVKETPEGFSLEVAAPGLKKEDFKLNINGNKLVISAKQEDQTANNEEKYARKEFSYTSFQRVFTLPKTVNGDKIEANYQEGILYITLPKKEEAVETPREIAVA